VVEMVLTGAINSEIVTLLNRDGAHAVGVSGKDGALLRAKKRVSDDGRDLGQVGEITEVNKDFLKLLIDQGYLPVISPVGIGQDGSSYNINADDAAAAVAAALHADKLIYLTDVPGILEGGELLSELTADQLEDKLGSGAITGGMRAKAEAIIKTVRAGVPRVHVVDGRMPHSVIGELFTDRGVGTLVTP
jgi:acetylglutamate kinase